MQSQYHDFLKGLFSEKDEMLLLGLYSVVSEKNVNDIAAQSYRLPVYGFFYSPHCGHCKQVHPTWNEVAEKYKSDKNILLIECDCESRSNICKKLFSVNGVPTFVKILRGNAVKIEISNRTFENIAEVAENLKTIDMSLKCRSYPGEFGDYPAFIVHSDHDKMSACSKLLKLEKKTQFYRNIYLGNSSQTPYFEVLFNEQSSFTSKDIISDKQILEYVNENGYEQFGKWEPKSALHLNREYGFLIYSAYNLFENLTQQISKDYGKHYVFSSVQTEVFDLIYKKKFDKPAIGISDSKKKRFMVVEDITLNMDNLRATLDRRLCSTMRAEMQYDLQPLIKHFRVMQPKELSRFYGVSHNWDDNNTKKSKKKPRMKLFFLIGSLSFIAVMVGYFVYIVIV